MMLKYLIQDFKNYNSLTHETRIKDAVNMDDLIYLLATVRTLNIKNSEIFFVNRGIWLFLIYFWGLFLQWDSFMGILY